MDVKTIIGLGLFLTIGALLVYFRILNAKKK